MIKVLNFPVLRGNVAAIPSKSEAHRALICSALSDFETSVFCGRTNADIESTADCLRALGVGIKYTNGMFSIIPPNVFKDNSQLDCGESGTTLRFMLPIAAAIGGVHTFYMRGRLEKRPLSPLDALLTANGTVLTRGNPLVCSGCFRGGELTISGGVSSQFISGLLFAMTLTGGSLTVEGETESAPYIEMTVSALRKFGADISACGRTYTVKKGQLKSPGSYIVGGDWSNAAFFLVAGAIGKGDITVTGLDTQSFQGDREIVEILRRMGANVTVRDKGVTSEPSRLHGIDVDASQIPDLIPTVAVAACAADGVTRVFNAARLRLKESDRISSICDTVNSLGGMAKATEDRLEITGCALTGGTVDSVNDHRIAMAAAVASLLCPKPVTITGAEAVGKSYPDFWTDFGGLII